MADWLSHPMRVLTPRVMITLVLAAVCGVLLTRTTAGRGFFLMGGNPQTAWYSGLRTRRYLAGAFVLSGLLSAAGGALYAMGEAVANPRMGEKSLMAIVAAVIIGGTSMEGGRGSVAGTAVAMIALMALIRGLNSLGAGYEIELMASGLVLALVILYDAWRIVQSSRIRGQRRELLAELAARPPAEDRDDTTEGVAMQTKDHTVALACVAMVACVAIAGPPCTCTAIRRGRAAVERHRQPPQGPRPRLPRWPTRRRTSASRWPSTCPTSAGRITSCW